MLKMMEIANPLSAPIAIYTIRAILPGIGTDDYTEEQTHPAIFSLGLSNDCAIDTWQRTGQPSNATIASPMRKPESAAPSTRG